MPAGCDAIKPMKRNNYGAHCEQGGLPGSNFDANIHSVTTLSIFIARPPNFPLSWMVFSMACRSNSSTMLNAKSIWRPMVLKNCASGTDNGD